MLRQHSYCDTPSDFAKLIYEKWQSEAYGLLACNIKYTEAIAEELKMKVFLNNLGICCENLICKPENKRCVEDVGCNDCVVNPSAFFEFAQLSASDTWVITHNLGFNPFVNVTDLFGNTILDSVIQYTTTGSVLTITFSSPRTGKVYLT